MKGSELKAWAAENFKVRPDAALAVKLNIAPTTVRSLFARAELPTRWVLAIAQLGCEIAQAEVSETQQSASGT